MYAATNEPVDHAVLRTLIGDDDTMIFPTSRETVMDLDLFTFEFLQ